MDPVTGWRDDEFPAGGMGDEPGNPNAEDNEPVAERKASASGGYYSIGKNRYWIPEPQYSEVLDRDDKTPLTPKGNKEFGKWLDSFVKDNSLIPEREKSKSLSGYWAMPYSGGGYYADGRGGKGTLQAETIEAAQTLKAMRTVVGVVDPEHKLQVEWNTGETSAWGGDKVTLPYGPQKEIKEPEERLNVMSGFSIHEAFHSIHTREIMATASPVTVKQYLKDPWNMALSNIAEDMRIEDRGLRDTPGYKEYLNYTHEFMWDEDLQPKKIKSPEDAMQTLYHMIRYPDRMDEIVKGSEFDKIREFGQDWVERYKEAQEKNPKWSTMVDFVEEAKKFLEIDSTTPPPTTKPQTICGYADGDKGMDGKEADRVDAAIEEEAERYEKDTKEMKDLMPHSAKSKDGNNMRSVVIRRPKTEGRYKPASGGLVAKAKAALVLRKNTVQHDTRLMRSGLLDEDELYRLANSDLRVFKDATVETIPTAAIYLLVDSSGSMGSPEYEDHPSWYANRIAQLFVEAMQHHPNITVKLLAHTATNRDNPGGGSFYRIWEQGDSLDRIELLNKVSRSENYDGFAIDWAGKMLMQEPVDQRLLLVLADGQPSAPGYGGESAIRHVRAVTDGLIRQGALVVQMAIGPYLTESEQSRMFKHYITSGPLNKQTFSVMLRKLTHLLRKFV